MTPEQRLVSRFLDLPYVTRMKVIRELGLTDHSDDKLAEVERYILYLKRASSRGLLTALRKAIDAEHVLLESDDG
jgi:hypothetical protein